MNRNHIVDRYCAIELREYRRIFRANDEVRTPLFWAVALCLFSLWHAVGITQVIVLYIIIRLAS